MASGSFTGFWVRGRSCPYLPDTRLLRGPADLAALLARHRTTFVKDVFSIKGRGVARVRLEEPGRLEVARMDDLAMSSSQHTDLKSILREIRLAAGKGRKVVQQGINITGREGRALDFRVLMVRDGLTRWRCPVISARVAPDTRVAFTNVAHGADEVEPLGALRRHFGMSPGAARDCSDVMVTLCTHAAEALGEQFSPLGILGFDVAVDAGNHRLWLLEANSVPGWGYGPSLDRELARSQAQYAFQLAGFPC